jgi:protein TonB
MVDATEGMRSERIRSALAVGALHLLFGYAFVTGLGFDPVSIVERELKLFDVAEPPPPPAEPPPPPALAEAAPPAGAPAPPDLVAKPSPIVAPPPEIRLDLPSPIVAAPIAGQGAEADAGAAEIEGPGTGAGGEGTGNGGGGRGGSGTGTRAAAGSGTPTPARKLGGALISREFAPLIMNSRRGDITFRIAVGPDGRVTDCAVERAIGPAEIGTQGCRLIRERNVYEPARDAAGQPTADVKFENHAWGMPVRRRRRGE